MANNQFRILLVQQWSFKFVVQYTMASSWFNIPGSCTSPVKLGSADYQVQYTAAYQLLKFMLQPAS